MEKRLIIAVALSILIVVSFQYLFGKPAMRSVQPPPQQTMPAVVSRPESAISTPESKPVVAERELEVATDKYILTFSNIGGSIKNIRLKNYKGAGSDEPLDLARITDPHEYIFAISDSASTAPLDLSDYSIEHKADTVTCRFKTGGLEITKEYTLHNNKYGIELRLLIKNISASPQPVNYSIIGGSGIIAENAQDKRMIELAAKINGRIGGCKAPKAGKIINPGIVSWIADKDKYFSMILKPLVITKSQFYSMSRDGYFVTGVNPDVTAIQPGSIMENKFVLYAGPGNITMLKEFGYELDETVNYGIFGGISKVLIAVMTFLYRIVHSWGLAIVLLSVLLNLVLFPLTAKSFKSMQKMQELHPQMEKLKKENKDNPQKLNKEIMELYKKYKINPLSGCLPMFLQMPVFFALYQALMKSIELRGASFLWIKDLSLPDAVKIPMQLPLLGNSINILPIVMVGAMVAQQRISTKSMGSAVTEEQKQQQKMMLIIMPIMFGFIFYNMPSGLVLYWVINTVMTMVEQAAILKKTE